MVNKNKEKHIVKDRWYGMRQGRTPKKREFAGKPQFTLEDLYISPLAFRRRYTEEGVVEYIPVEREMSPSGVEVMDAYLRRLAAGDSNLGRFCKCYGARTGDMDSLCFLLTGMTGAEFRLRYMVRLADDLLRYTSMTLDEVARRSGHGKRVNLFFAYKRDYGVSPLERRNQLRASPADVGRFRLE
ncbi:hypothetical protein [Parabacteroides sp.]